MSLSILFSILLLALVATPHCASMCGCGLASRPLSEARNTQLGFQLGRVGAYTALGAVAGGAHATLTAWAVGASGMLAVLHYMLLAALGFVGIIMLASPGRVLFGGAWVPVRFTHAKPKLGLLGGLKYGLRWLAMPCGVIYAGIGMAYLTGSAVYGAVVMLVLGTATALPLQASQFANQWVRKRWGEKTVTRVQGAAIMLGLAMLLARQADLLPTPAVLQGLGFCL